MSARPPRPDARLGGLPSGYRIQRESVFAELAGQRLPVVHLGLEEIQVSERLPKLRGEYPLRLTVQDRLVGPVAADLHVGEKAGRLHLHHHGPDAVRTMGAVLQDLLAAGLAEPPASKIAVQEDIADPGLVRARIRALAAHRAPALVRAGGAVLRGTAVPTRGDADVLVLSLDGPVPDGDGDVDVELVGYNSLYRFRAEGAVRAAEGLRMPLPARLLRLQHRHSPRAPASAGMHVLLRHPLLPDLRIQRPLRDVSRNGLSFHTHLREDLLHPGMVLDGMEVLFPGGAPVRLDGEVRIVVPAEGDAAVCGLRLSPVSDMDAARWFERVGNLLLPTTRVSGTWSEDLWDLYDASGYFSLSGKTTAHFAPLRRPFANVVRRLDRDPRLGVQVSWPSSRGVEASVTLLRTYTHGWLGFQMAKRPGEPVDGGTGRQVLRETMLRAYEHAQVDPELRWFLGFVQDAARWSKLVHCELPVRYQATGLAAMVPFHTFEVPLTDRWPVPPAGWDVQPATAAECEALLADLATRRPAAYMEALDLVPDRLDLARLREAWAGAGLNRERTIVCARRHGRTRATLMLEAADTGAHLFGLLDCIRIWGSGPDWREAIPALVAYARGWYAARGKSMFTCLLEDVRPEDVQRLGLTDLGGANMTLIGVDLVSSFMEHIVEVTAPRRKG